MTAVITKPLMLLGIVTLALVSSGCIEPDEFYDEWESDWDGHTDETWADADHDAEMDDEWCPEDGQVAADEDGDVQSDDIADAYDDAAPRFHNVVDGEEDASRRVDIDLGTDELRVALVYDLDGDVTIRLRNPLGVTAAVEHFDGEKEMQEDYWFVESDPMPGDWKLSIDVDGEGGYTIGFFIDD